MTAAAGDQSDPSVMAGSVFEALRAGGVWRSMSAFTNDVKKDPFRFYSASSTQSAVAMSAVVCHRGEPLSRATRWT